MTFSELENNQTFIFKEDPEYPYVKIAGACFDALTQVLNDKIDPMAGTIKVDRSLLWTVGARENVARFIIEERVTRAIKANDFVSRSVYYYKCLTCKKQRGTRKIEIARTAICRKCRHIQRMTAGTIPLFEYLND